MGKAIHIPKPYRRIQRDGSPSETFFARFQYRGVRVDESTGVTSQEEYRKWVRRKKAQLDAEASQRLLKKSERLTVHRALDLYWEEHLKHVKNSDRSDSYRIAKMEDLIGKNLPLEHLTTAHMKSVIARMRDGGSMRGGKPTDRKLAANTINRDVRIIQAMHNMAREIWEYPGLKPIAWRKLHVKGPARVIKAPTVEQVRVLVSKATPRLGRVIMFAALTGFRLDEIRELYWINLDLEQSPAMVTSIGKGDKEVMLPLSSAATSLLLSIPPGSSSRVFDVTNFDREWDAAREAAGLRHIRFHDLRHAFATWFRATLKETQGAVDPMAMKDALRHSDIATSSIYAHADNRDLLPSLDLVAAKLLGSPETLSNLLPTESEPPDEESSS